MPSYDFGTQSVPSFPVSSSISRARVPPAIQTKHAPASRARSPLPGSAASSSGHAHRPSTADSTTGTFPAPAREGHLLRAFDVARSRSPSPRPEAGQAHTQQHHQTSHLLESGLRKLRSMGRSSKEKEKDKDRAPSYAHRQVEAFNPTASAPAMALSFGNRSRTPPHNVTSFTAIRPNTPPSSSGHGHHQQYRAPPHTATASSFRPQHAQAASLAVPAPHASGARSADPFSASFSDTIRRDPFAARDQVEHHSHSHSHSQSRSRRNSLRENGAPQPRSGPAPAKITTSSSARKDKGKAPAYIPSNASTSSSSLPAPAPAPPAAEYEQPRPAPTPAPVQEQRPAPKQPKTHQKSASSGVFSGFAAAPMGMGLPSTFPAKPRTNRAVTDTSLTGVPRQRSVSASQSQQAQGEHEFVYALGNVHGSSASPGPATFNFSIARTSSREGVSRKRANEPPKPLPPVPQSAPGSAVDPQPPEPILEITPAAIERLAGRAKGKTPLTPATKTPFSPAVNSDGTPLTPAFVGMTASPAQKFNALPRQDDTMLSPMTAGGPTSAGTPLSGASALSMWEDSPLGPPPSLVDAASPSAQKPEPVRPAMRSRWAPRSDAGSDDEQLRSALESVLSPDTSAAAKPKDAAARPKMRRRASSLDSHYRLATPARTRFYDPPALFMPPTSSAAQLDNVGEEAAPEQPRSARSRSFIISPRDTDARDFVNAMLRGDVKLDPALVDTRQPVRGGGKVPSWELHNRGLSIDTNFEFGAPPSRPKRQHPPPPPSKHANSDPAPATVPLTESQDTTDAPEKKSRPKTRTVTTLWTELWHDVHSAPFDSPASPGMPLPPLPTSLATAPAHAHALPAAPSRSSTLGSAPPNSHRNSTLSTLSSVPSLSAFPMPPSPPPVPKLPAAAALAKQQQLDLAQVPGGPLSSPALPSLNFGSPLTVSFGDSPRSLFSSMSGPMDFLSPARSTASGRSSSVFASSPASARSFGSGSGEMLAAPSGLRAASKLVPRTAE